MNRVVSILILAGIAIGSMQAAEVKQQIKYNAQATQKLQEKLNTVAQQDVGTGEFFKAVDELLLQGADPNVFRADPKDPNNKNGTLIALLFASPLLGVFTGATIDFKALENTLKTAFSYGAHLGNEGGLILLAAVAIGTPTMVKLAIDHGADITYKDENGDTPLTATQKGIQQLKDGLKQIKEVTQPEFQKDIARLEQIRQVLNTAKNMKTAQKTAQYNQEATQKLQAKIDSITNGNGFVVAQVLKTIDELINQGADPNIDHSATMAPFEPILSYLSVGSRADDIVLVEKVTENLLERGANPNFKDSAGNSILQNATLYGTARQVQLLIEYGADVSVKNGSGKSIMEALDAAIADEKSRLERLTQTMIPRAQDHIKRLEQLLEILKTAEQKK
jgi:hypothetical protein